MRLIPAATRLSLPVLAFAFTACASTQSPQEATTVTVQPAAATAVVTIPTDIATIHPAFVTAWQGTDPVALKVYFSDDAVVTTPAGVYTGWTDISGKYITPLLPTMSKYTLTPIGFTREGDAIIETGNYGYVVTHEGGHTMPVNGTYTYRWVKGTDGTWRLAAVTIK